MDDANITKQAIDEILKDMNVYKEYENRGQERKMNPLGKPNKRFLDRTLNSVLNHNKRESERTRKLCQRKLRHLDRKRQKIENHKVKRVHSKVPSRPSSLTYVASNNNDSTDDEKYNVRKRKKHKQTKKKKSRKRNISISSSTSTSDDENINGGKSLSGQCTDGLKNQRQAEHMYDNVEHVNWNTYYADANLASFTTLAYNHHVTRLWCQHQQFVNQHIPANIKPSDSDPILSDLTLNSSSEASLNVSFNCSSGEEDEKGILTFQLSSDYNEDDHDDKPRNCDKVLALTDDDNCSIQTHISLNSGECPVGKQKSNDLTSITLLSSDSEVENENEKSSATRITADLSGNKLIVDLTED